MHLKVPRVHTVERSFLQFIFILLFVGIESCSKIHEIDPAATDGEYKLWYPSDAMYIKIYCHNMASTPSEYLTLPAGGTSNFIYKGGGGSAWGEVCRGSFSKVRLVLTSPLQIKREDIAFMATSSSTCSPLNRLPVSTVSTDISGFGGATSCNYAASGQFKIDLSGTFYKIPDTVSWRLKGHSEVMANYFKSSDGQIVSANCGGGCGFCNPSSGTTYIPLELTGN